VATHSSPLLHRLSFRPIPALDGFRALSVLTVILFHLEIGQLGPYGVMGFFVLSGFLITWLLLQEHAATGGVSLRGFYLRRTFRIFPAFYVFWAIYVTLDVLYLKRSEWRQYFSVLFYLGNYYKAIVNPAHLAIQHNWSLAIEEQFYLLWPWVFRRFQNNLHRLSLLLAGIIVFVWVYRFVLYFGFGAGERWLYYAFDARADHLAIGCLLAILLHRRKFVGGFAVLCGHAASPAITLAALAAVLWWVGPFNTGLAMTWGYAVIPVLLGILMVQWIAWSGCWPWKLLEWPPMRFIGKISYSLYLYHWLVCWVVLFRMPPMHPLARIAIALPGSIAVASMSYYFVELPFLRLKERFRVRSANSSVMVG
jgi:peptidoglycan/LPS O-acetylase OafA/YrhL